MQLTYDPKLLETTVETIQMLSVDAVEKRLRRWRSKTPGHPEVASRRRAWLG